jgi:putative transposase
MERCSSAIGWGVFGGHTMMGAVGVDAEGRKHVLGIRKGATENATVVAELLQDIVARGLDPEQKRMFIIDGSKALRAAINAVFGADHPVQQSRARKLRNAGVPADGSLPMG